MPLAKEDIKAIRNVKELGSSQQIDITGGKIRRTSSRFCLGVEHGDYNGTELFGVGTDRFIWLAYRPNGTDRVKLFSGNFPDDGIIEFKLGSTPEPKSESIADSWGRFPCGADYILNREGIKLSRGIDGIIYGNIPGGGMSRSASLTINLILSLLDANNIQIEDKLKIVDMAQAVENDYIGSPCGQLDQIMILFAKKDMGTHYNPARRSIDYVPLGKSSEDFRIVVLDTGTVRPGLEKSTYKIRRSECEQLVKVLQNTGRKINSLAEITEKSDYAKILKEFQQKEPDLCDRFRYIFNAQQRFYEMMEAWKAGDIETVGSLFRADGIGLRDLYKISGPQLETMCDIARTVPGVLGERMLGGGDKGAAGALVKTQSVNDLTEAVECGYPRSHPEYAGKYAVHPCKVVDGVSVLKGMLE